MSHARVRHARRSTGGEDVKLDNSSVWDRTFSVAPTRAGVNFASNIGWIGMEVCRARVGRASMTPTLMTYLYTYKEKQTLGQDWTKQGQV